MIPFIVGVIEGILLSATVLSVAGCLYLERKYPEILAELQDTEEVI